jgi:small subunit ribosomal protein S2
MAVVTMKALLESGVHFGHRTHRWHPAMNQYIFTERNGIHIINLQLTVKALDETYNLVRGIVAEGGTVLFVGTKRQAQETIEVEATRCGMPFVTARWLGGMLTNYRTIRERINELERLERRQESGEFDHLTKKEALMLSRKILKLQTRFSGTRNMVGLPELLFAVDVRREETSIHEANLLNIPVVAMVDTNCDPRDIDYIIPSNDDAIRAIKLIVGKMADAVLEGKALHKEDEEVFAEAGELAEVVELSDEELLGEATLAKLRDIEVEGAPVSEEAESEVTPVEEAETDVEAEVEDAEAVGEVVAAEEEAETEVEAPVAEEEAEVEVEAPVAEEEAEVEVEAPVAEEEAEAEVEAPVAAEKAEAAVEAETVIAEAIEEPEEAAEESESDPVEGAEDEAAESESEGETTDGEGDGPEEQNAPADVEQTEEGSKTES